MTGKPGRSGRKPTKPVTAVFPRNLVLEGLQPPDWLSPLSKQKFLELRDVLAQTNLPMCTADIDAMACYAEAWQDFFDACEVIEKHGAEIWGVDGRGNKTCAANPAVRRKSRATERIKAGMVRFGLSPADRSYLRVPPNTTPNNAFSGFVAKGKTG